MPSATSTPGGHRPLRGGCGQRNGRAVRVVVTGRLQHPRRRGPPRGSAGPPTLPGWTPRAAVPPPDRVRGRLGAAGPAGRRRGDRPHPGRHLADGVPVGAARPRCWTTGTPTRPTASWRAGDHRAADARARRAGRAGAEHRRRLRRLRSGGAEPPASAGPGGPTTEISTLLVEPRWGRRGHGSRLLVRRRRPRPRRWRRPPAGLAARGRPRRPPASTSRPAGHPTGGPARWTPATRRCARSAGTRCWTGRPPTAEGARVSFEGFPDEGLVFYEGLEADNSKTYWTRAQGRLRRARAGAAAGAARGAGAGVRDGEGVPAVPRRPLQQRQDARTRPTRAPSSTPRARAPAPGTCRSPPTGCGWPAGAGGWSPTRWPGTGARWPTTSRVRACRPRSTGWRPPDGRSRASG